ncbi:hypothetical protein [Rubellicoccus peritrichatus]|uniref:SLA1 homology domain-containing protein n=1 Tax=Rubellicoccus peritrichatus TaxID=3080537 RepID=A0AAQ3LD83_9BACT|nr:hypothetical protein [Puniceicoccus sp. CR14]WOO42309.1 hypothetical protein RZN69_04350 [Puniceicoccus sp. CR14]
MKSFQTGIVFLFLAFSADLSARIWTSADGRTLDAELVSIEKGSVTVQRQSDLRKFTIPIQSLSEKDQKYLEEYSKNAKKLEEGIVALMAKYPSTIKKKVYKGHGKVSFRKESNAYKYYKDLEVNKPDIYDRYKRSFAHIDAVNIKSQLGNIRSRFERDLKLNEQRMKGSTQIALQAQLNVEWFEKSLEPYLKKWEMLAEEI